MKSRLPYLLQSIPDFRDGLLDRLSASESSLLCLLTGMTLSEREHRRHLHPLRQIGDWEGWVRRKLAEGFSVTLVGTDVEKIEADISRPLESWHEGRRPGRYTIWIAVIHPQACFEVIRADQNSEAVSARMRLEHRERSPHVNEHLFESDWNPNNARQVPSITSGDMSAEETAANVLAERTWSLDGPVLNARTLILRPHQGRPRVRGFCGDLLRPRLVETVGGSLNRYRTTYLNVSHTAWMGETLIQETEAYLESHWNQASWSEVSQSFIELSVMHPVGEIADYAVFRIPTGLAKLEDSC